MNKAILLVMAAGVMAVQEPDAEKRLRERYDNLSVALRAAKTAEDVGKISDDLLALCDEAVSEDLYELAVKAAEQAVRAVRGSRNQGMLERAQMAAARARALQKEYGRVKTAAKTLDANKDDAEANLALGRFFCLIKEDWDRGLPHLAKGSDPVLKAAAEADLAAPKETSAQMAVADLWWDVGKRYPSAKQRALHWYTSAWYGLVGSERERVRRMFQAIIAKPCKEHPAPPPSWNIGDVDPRQPHILLDEQYARSGKTSVRLSSRPRGWIYSDKLIVRPGKKYVVSFWVLSEGPVGDGCILCFQVSDGSTNGTTIMEYPVDRPWWFRMEKEVTSPNDAVAAIVGFTCRSKEGRVWVDDVSFKDAETGAELLRNNSFER